MTVMVSILPILIIILFVTGIGTYTFKSHKKRYRSPRRMKWFIGGYTILLFVATVISYTFFPGNPTESKSFSEEEISKIENEQDRMINLALNGTLPKTDGIFIKKKTWAFPYEEKDLKIADKYEQEYDADVFVVSKPSDDGVVEAAHYMGKMIVDGIDFTEKKNSPKINVEESTLRIKSPEGIEMNFTKFSEGFAFDQFTSGQSLLSRSYFSVHGSEFILLKVPKSVKVSGDFNYVNME